VREGLSTIQARIGSGRSVKDCSDHGGRNEKTAMAERVDVIFASSTDVEIVNDRALYFDEITT
jgi:hypothetical protein